MSARCETHKHAIPLAGHAGLTDQFHEVSRFGVSKERSFVLVAPDVVKSPRSLGSLPVECVHTAGAGYSAATGVSEADALAELWLGFDEERASLSGDRAEKDVH